MTGDDPRPRLDHLRTTLLAFALLVTACHGVRSTFDTERDPMRLLTSTALAYAVTYACVVDGELRRRTIVPMGQFAMLFTWPVAVPLYLVWSRGWRGILWSLGWAVVFLIVAGGGVLGAHALKP